RRARLVVVNHALLGADLMVGGKVLGPYDLLVVDEAHGLPGSLRDAFTLQLAPGTVAGLLGELRGRDGGLLAHWGGWTPVGEVVRAWRRAAAAHRRLWQALEPLIPADPGRYAGEQLAPAGPAAEALDRALAELAAGLVELAGGLPEEEQERARATAEEVGRVGGNLRALMHPTDEDYVFWHAREEAGPVLRASPVELGEQLADRLWAGLHGAVLTSATLGTGRDAEPLARQLGLAAEDVVFHRFPSPFSFSQVGAYALSFLPHPDHPDYPAALAEVLRLALAAAPCRALALFTSRRLLGATQRHLAGLPVLVQGEHGQRGQLLARFRDHPPPVLLLGLDTFWEGVDLPGRELELLFVTRLPFPVPTDPVAQAQAERLRARGQSPFELLFLPQAVLRLRQGAGRLVRSPHDRGAVVVTDPRAVRRSYGQHFLRALPVPPVQVDEAEQLAAALHRLFGAAPAGSFAAGGFSRYTDLRA
ncbi:MAG: ATP-dependent DNA helicase, partial [Candidatus Bipolaricaulaceae bacterium]